MSRPAGDSAKTGEGRAHGETLGRPNDKTGGRPALHSSSEHGPRQIAMRYTSPPGRKNEARRKRHSAVSGGPKKGGRG
jgi:hypothetical protein